MARDLIHDAVKNALINDGWTITDDPFEIKIVDEEDRKFQIDLGAEKLIAIEKGKEKIVVEVKTFGGTSVVYKFHEALGQFLDYKAALEESKIIRDLYLAVSTNTYDKLIEMNFLRRRIAQYNLKFIVIDIRNKQIKKWIK